MGFVTGFVTLFTVFVTVVTSFVTGLVTGLTPVTVLSVSVVPLTTFESPFGAANALKINPYTLRSRMKKLGIDWRMFRLRSQPTPS